MDFARPVRRRTMITGLGLGAGTAGVLRAGRARTAAAPRGAPGSDVVLNHHLMSHVTNQFLTMPAAAAT